MPSFERPPLETLAMVRDHLRVLLRSKSRGRNCAKTKRYRKMMRSTRSQENDLPLGICGRCGFGEGFQVGDAAANGKVKLPRIDHRGERLAHPLAAHGLGNQVFILREEDAAQRGGAVQKVRVFEAGGAVV